MSDTQRLEECKEADQRLLDLLERQGDDPETVRPVDLRMKGKRVNLERLRGALGPEWRVQQLVDLEDGSWALDLDRDQATDTASVRALTDLAIQYEDKFDIEYDGWGCIAQIPDAGGR